MIRDIRSFIPETKPKNELLSIEENFEPEPVIESLVDHGRLEALAFQREVLNWRDNAHAHLTEELIELHKKFCVKIDIELGNISLFKKLIWIQSDEVLQDIFIQSVKIPFLITIRKEEEKLEYFKKTYLSSEKFSIFFDKYVLEKKCYCVTGIRFKSSNRKIIVDNFQDFMLGKNGISNNFCKQITRMSEKLIEKKKPS